MIKTTDWVRVFEGNKASNIQHEINDELHSLEEDYKGFGKVTISNLSSTSCCDDGTFYNVIVTVVFHIEYETEEEEDPDKDNNVSK